MIRSYRYRLYPADEQAHALGELLAGMRELWNAALEERREAWKRAHISITYYEQANQLKAIRALRDDFARWNYSAAQQVLRRVDKAFKAFFRRVKAGETPGFPRFKGCSRFCSVEFRFGDGARLSDGRLYVQGIGAVKVKWHRAIPTDARVKAVVVKRESDDHWYATFQLEQPDPEPGEHPGEPVGVDLGVTTLAALSTGEMIEAPRHFRKTARKLRKQQRRAARRKKFSKRWRKAQKQVAKTHRMIANQRRDASHKLSRRLVTEFALIAVEALNVHGLSRSKLSKSIHDAGWSQLRFNLDYKAAEAGSRVVAVDPRHTSQVCSGCGRLVPKSLSVRVHRCPDCGLVLDRDVNAARNILRRALDRLGRSLQASTYPGGDRVA